MKAIFNAATSVNQIVYATGLRVSEVARLRLNDLDRARHLITVRAGKGKKDRIVMLTDKLETTIVDYLTHYKPTTFLFENAESQEPLDKRVIQSVYSETVRFTGIQKQGGIHTLRHSFATHLLEAGTDIRYI